MLSSDNKLTENEFLRPRPIDLVTIPANFILVNKLSLAHYISNTPSIFYSKHQITINLGINEKGQLLIYPVKPFVGIEISKSNSNILGLKWMTDFKVNNNATSNEIAEELLEDYSSFLIVQHSVQHKLSDQEILNYSDYKRLFTGKAYIDWLVPRLLTFAQKRTEWLTSLKWTDYNADYFAKRLLVMPNVQQIIGNPYLCNFIVSAIFRHNPKTLNTIELRNLFLKQNVELNSFNTILMNNNLSIHK